MTAVSATTGKQTGCSQYAWNSRQAATTARYCLVSLASRGATYRRGAVSDNEPIEEERLEQVPGSLPLRVACECAKKDNRPPALGCSPKCRRRTPREGTETLHAVR